jgi:hypothetical protein
MQTVQFKVENTFLSVIETLLDNIRFIQDFSIIKENKAIDSDSNYFKSKEDEYIFYLVELDGELQQEKLNIDLSLYKDKAKAKRWRNEIIKIIHPDTNRHPNVNDATAKLNTLYGRMIENAK